ncbi:hypothetical protein [Kibdelosporangium aridum]|uniref:Uncharacterized protein n=1 Tax=Kibdelosporangium aridum TaxID=2030 RepID=A0A1W2FAQ9_KIBAR|nr:hypothetical protein [Kibdelosporangium aridum]SMD18945.1 hypothetical protein SAMN05661093_05981 [Kibdelosporangium aridum]
MAIRLLPDDIGNGCRRPFTSDVDLDVVTIDHRPSAPHGDT